MKHVKLLSFLALTLLATGCGTVISNSESAQPSESKETTAPVSEKESESIVSTDSEKQSDSESESTSTEPVKKGLDLSAVQTGYDLKLTMAEEDEYGTSYDAYEVKVSDGVLIYDDYYSSGERKSGWNDTALALKTRTQYEAHDFEEEGLLSKVTSDLACNPVYTQQNLKDPLTGEDSATTFEDAFVVNAFQFLTADDFTENTDGTYSLVITDAKKNEETFAKAYYGLNHQFYPVLSSSYDGSNAYFKLDSLAITSFSIIADDNGLPVSFTMAFEDETVWGSTTKRTITADVVKTGADSAEKYTAPEAKYEELDEKIKALQNGNFSFTAKVGLYEDSTWSYVTPTAMFTNGTFDGSVLTLTGYKNGSEQKEYYKVNSTDHYRAFTKSGSKYVYSGDEVDESSSSNKLMPTFAFSSSTFNRVAASENDSGINVYSFNKPLLYSGYAYTSLFIGYKNNSLVTSIDSNLLVTTTKDTITFDFTDSAKERSYNITYYALGTTSAFTGSIEEPSTEA